MFIVHNNACRPSQDGFQTESSSNGDEVDISFAQLVDVGGLVMMLSYVRKKGSSANMPLLPKAFPSSPSLGAKSVTQWIRVSLLPGTLG